MLNLTYSPNVCAYSYNRSTKTLTLRTNEAITKPTIAYRASTLRLVVADLPNPLPVDDVSWASIFSNYMNIQSVNGTPAPWLLYYKRSWQMITVQPTWTNYDDVPDYIKTNVNRVWIPANNTEDANLFDLSTTFPNAHQAYYYGDDIDNQLALASSGVQTSAPNSPIKLKNGGRTIEISGQVEWDIVKNIRDHYPNVENISLPDQTGNMPGQCFLNCTWLKSFSAPNIVELPVLEGYGVFEKCTALTSVLFQSVTTIGNYAFYGCSSLETISFPLATTIEYCAFNGCTALSSISLPSAITIDSFAFASCSTLHSVSLPKATTTKYCAFASCIALSSISLPQVITIGNSTFNGCTALVSISLPEATSIEHGAFLIYSSLVSVSFPKVGRIESGAFVGCTALQSVSFGAEIISFILDVFNTGNNNLSAQITLTLSNAIERAKASNKMWNGCEFKEILPTIPMQITITNPPTVSGDELTIPNNFTYTPTAISLLEAIIEALNVTTRNAIKTITFNVALSTDNMNTLNNLNAIIPNLENINLNSQTGELPSNLFPNNFWLKSFSANNITTIKSSTFAGCVVLQSISLPSATDIGYYAFRYCYELTDIYLCSDDEITFGDNYFDVFGSSNNLNRTGITLYLGTAEMNNVTGGNHWNCKTSNSGSRGGAGYTFGSIVACP